MKTDVLILGAGASGLICAREAAERGRSVVVLDHARKPGSKILVSGGGRCNFTNLFVSADNYVSENRHFCRSALARFTPENFISLLKSHNIPYREKADGQLFCVRTADDILGMLRDEAEKSGAVLQMPTTVKKLRKVEGFETLTDRGMIRSEAVVVATGGLSFPELGASGLGYSIAKEFGLAVNRPRPGLVPLRFDKITPEEFSGLSGTSMRVAITCGSRSFTGSMLITHNGLSGPPVLQISLYWREGESLSINLLPDLDAHAYLCEQQNSRALLPNLLSGMLPKRFIGGWCSARGFTKPIYQYNQSEIRHIADALQDWKISPAGTAGYEKAEVTVGGVDCNELSSKTMESKKVPGLFFAGEVIDVTGQLGGYNLQWAWSSGYVAGQYA